MVTRAARRWTEADLSKFEQNSGRTGAVRKTQAEVRKRIGGEIAPRKLKAGTKFNNIEVMIGTKKFRSKLEARRFGELCGLQKARLVRWFIRNPRFDLPGDTTYEADFLVIWDPKAMHGHGNVGVEDTKGVETQVFKIKMRQMREIYGIEVELIKAGDSRPTNTAQRTREAKRE